jgi:hypothetical protein
LGKTQKTAHGAGARHTCKIGNGHSGYATEVCVLVCQKIHHDEQTAFGIVMREEQEEGKQVNENRKEQKQQ